MTSPNSKSTEVAQYFNNIVSAFLASISTIDANVLASAESCFQSISNTYRKGLSGPGRKVDWRDNCYRGVYVHRFFALHSYLVYQSLHLALADKKYLTEAWNNEPCFRVCCIGGGPGSDALGLTKFLRDTGLVPTNRLECTILDYYQQWEDTWKKITDSNANVEFPPMTYFSRDMTRGSADLSILDKIRSADIVSFVKFFSTVAAAILADATRGNLLREVFRELKPGALVLYIDNIFGDLHGGFKRLASSGGVTEVLFENIYYPISMPVTRRSLGSRLFDAAIDVAPLLSCLVTVMLLRKPPMDNRQNIPSEAEPIHTEAENALEAELIHTEADNAAEPIHIETDNALEAEPIHTEADEALLEAEPIHTEADNALEAEPIHTEADEALLEAEPMHTEAGEALPEPESILSMTTAPIVAPGDIKSDVQPQDTDQVSMPLKLRSKVNPSGRFTPYR